MARRQSSLEALSSDPSADNDVSDTQPNHDKPAPPADIPPDQQPSPEQPGSPLWLVLRRNPSGTKERLSQWIARVQRDGAGAVAEVLSIAIHAIAPQHPDTDDNIEPRWVTTDAVMTDRVSNTLANIEDELQQLDAPLQLLLSKDKQGKLFRRHYEDLWTKLVVDCPPEIIYNTDAIDTAVSWLLTMSGSKLRDVRFVAALSAYRILDGLIRVSERNRTQSVAFEKQLDIEKKRKRVAESKVNQLETKLDKIASYQQTLGNLFDDIVKGCFVLKYRDVSPEIRTLSIRSLGSWIMACPSHFLDDSHLKYIGWILSDKDAHVRQAALQTCLALINKTSDELFPNLEPFLDRFSQRIVQMCRDVDTDTAATAIKVCHALLPHDLLGEAQCDIISKQAIVEQDTRIRNTAAAFVAEYLQHKMDATKSQRGVLHELIANYFPDKAEPAVLGGALNSLWGHLPVLTEWESYSKLLVPNVGNSHARRRSSSSSTVSRSLAAGQMANVAGLLLAACARTYLDHKKDRNDSGNPSNSWDTTGMTNSVGKYLPRLLSEFQSDSEVTGILCQLPLYLDLDVFKTGKMETSFKELLKSFEGSLSRHSASKQVLSRVCRTVHFLAITEHALRGEAEATLKSIATSVAKSLHAIVQVERETNVTSSAVSAALSRASSAARYFPLQPEETCFEDCITVLEQCYEGNERFLCSNLAEDIGILAQSTCTWLYKTYKGSDCSIVDYCTKRDELLDALRKLMSKEDNVLMSSYSAVTIVVLVTLNHCLALEAESEEAMESLQIHDAPTQLALLVSDRLGSLYYECEETDETPEEALFEARLKLISSVIQASHTHAFGETLHHLPLIGLSDKLMGESDARIYNLSKAHHQDLRDNNSRRVFTLEKDAIVFAGRYESEDESYVGLLASAIAQRYSVSKPGRGPEKLVESLMEHYLCPWPTTDDVEAASDNLERSCIPFIQRIEKSRTPVLLGTLLDLTRGHVLDLDSCDFAGLQNVRRMLKKEPQPKSILKVSQKARKMRISESRKQPIQVVSPRTGNYNSSFRPSPVSQDPLLLRRSTRTRRALITDLAKTFEEEELEDDEDDEDVEGKASRDGQIETGNVENEAAEARDDEESVDKSDTGGLSLQSSRQKTDSTQATLKPRRQLMDASLNDVQYRSSRHPTNRGNSFAENERNPLHQPSASRRSTRQSVGGAVGGINSGAETSRSPSPKKDDSNGTYLRANRSVSNRLLDKVDQQNESPGPGNRRLVDRRDKNTEPGLAKQSTASLALKHQSSGRTQTGSRPSGGPSPRRVGPEQNLNQLRSSSRLLCRVVDCAEQAIQLAGGSDNNPASRDNISVGKDKNLGNQPRSSPRSSPQSKRKSLDGVNQGSQLSGKSVRSSAASRKKRLVDNERIEVVQHRASPRSKRQSMDTSGERSGSARRKLSSGESAKISVVQPSDNAQLKRRRMKRW